jgi:hypothetical protein
MTEDSATIVRRFAEEVITQGDIESAAWGRARLETAILGACMGEIALRRAQ